MSTAWTRIARMLGITIPTSIAVMAMTGGAAWAQTIYQLEGSDTLNEVILNSITVSGAALKYNNPGSGQAEKNMVHNSAWGSPVDNYQGIGPMSRNFQAVVLDPNCASDGNCTGATYLGYSAWAPTPKEVIGLDAALLSVATVTGNCPNITATLANPDDPSLAAVNSDLAIILGGYNSTGTSKATTAECSDPMRLAALSRLVSCMGINRIDHIFRRDDTSGTQDTFREHLQFPRWCNGKSKGNGNVNAGSGGNLSNQDLDPIRRKCSASSSTLAPTTCTYYPLNIQCQSTPTTNYNDPTYGSIPCTQGLVVALSEADPGSKDITESIGKRVVQSKPSGGFVMGLAGLASVDATNPLLNGDDVGVTVNTITYEDTNIRNGAYLTARRLFLNRKPIATYTPHPCEPWPTCVATNFPPLCVDPPCADPILTWSGDPDYMRNKVESDFYAWVTNRCNVIDIVKTAGFLPPLDDCHPACDDTSNIACVPASYGISTPNQNIGAEGPGGVEATGCASNPCVANGKAADSSGNCGGVAAGKCPVIPAVGSGAACNLADSAKCSSPTTCQLDPSIQVAGKCCPAGGC